MMKKTTIRNFMLSAATVVVLINNPVNAASGVPGLQGGGVPGITQVQASGVPGGPRYQGGGVPGFTSKSSRYVISSGKLQASGVPGKPVPAK